MIGDMSAKVDAVLSMSVVPKFFAKKNALKIEIARLCVVVMVFAQMKLCALATK